jgi:photosystem II stability/assembly factor-like uncharacterized protein
VHTNDGGQTWEIDTIPGTKNYLGWGLSLLGSDTVFWSLDHIGGGGTDRLYRTNNGGQTWQLVLQDQSAGYQVHFFDALNGLIYRDPYHVKYTTDGGLNWNVPANIPAGLATTGIFNYPGSDTDVQGNSYFTGLVNGQFFTSNNRGQTWKAFPTPLQTPLSDLAFENETTGLAASTYTVFKPSLGWTTGGKPSKLIRTSDGGQTWSEIPAAQLPFPGQKLFISVMTATGVPGEYIMDAGPNEQDDNYTTFRSTDGGLSWQVLTQCPDEALGTMAFKSPNVGWAGNSLLKSTQDAMFFKWDPQASKVVFTVDLGNLPPSPAGVHLATDLFGWNPTKVPMVNVSGTTLWTAELLPPPGAEIHYRFVNGINLTDAELVPNGCGILDNGIVVRTTQTTGCEGAIVPAVLYGHCLPNGELAPQTTGLACDSTYIVCENFDEYQNGVLGPQTDLWLSNGCVFPYVEGDSCDAQIDGYNNGFTNYSGINAMHLNGLYAKPNGQSIQLIHDTINSGIYEMAMKVYLPTNRGGGPGIGLNQNYSSFDFVFAADGTLALNTYNGVDQTYLTDTTVSFQFNKWLDVRMVFDFDKHYREFWLENVLIFAVDDPNIAELLQVNFVAFTGEEWFVDDVTLRKLNPVKTYQPDQSSTSALQVSPNPAVNHLTLQLANRPAGALTAQLLDALGRPVRQQTMGTTITFEVQDLPVGIYTAVVRDPKWQIVGMQRWIKQ